MPPTCRAADSELRICGNTSASSFGDCSLTQADLKPSSSRDTRKATLSIVSSRPATESAYYQTPATETEQNVVIRASEPPSSINLNDGDRSTGGVGEESV